MEVIDPDSGVLTSDPMRLLAAQRSEYARLWADRGGKRRRWYSATREALPRLEPAQLRAVAGSIREASSQTYDGFHPRHLSLLSNAALESLAVIYETAERLGSWPSQVELITLPTIPKPSGGCRLIGIFAAICRVWSKARRDIASDWELRNDRGYFASGADRCTADTVWLQSAAAEAQLAEEGHVAAAVLLDLEKFFEYIDHDALFDRAVRLGLPEPLVRLALASYAGPRRIRLRDFIAQEVYADRGVVAGCSLASTLIKAYVIEAYDEFVEQAPGIRFDSHVDDNVLSCEGGEIHVQSTVTRAAAIMSGIVRDRLLCKVARRKTHVVTTKEALGARILSEVRASIGGEQAATAPSLGIDYAAGRIRARWRRRSTASTRIKRGLRRRARLSRLRDLMGSRAVSIFATGVLPAMVYGAEVGGVSDTELALVRKVAAAALRPRARGRSLNMTLLIHGDPAWRAATAPVCQYVRMVWRAAAGSRAVASDARVTLPGIRRYWEAVDFEQLMTTKMKEGVQIRKRRWDRVRGPIGAAHLSLERLGWSFDGPFRLTDDLGVTRNIMDHSPRMWNDLLREAVQRSHERGIAAKWARRCPRFGGRRICIDHIRPYLGSARCRARRSKLDPLGAGTAASVVAGAVWPNARAHRADNRVDAKCQLCGAAQDTIFHRLWWCSATEQERKAIVGGALIREARSADPHDPFYTTGVMAHPADWWPRPPDLPQVVVERFDGGPLDGVIDLEGDMYIDGSCSRHAIPELQRASWAFVVRAEDGGDCAIVSSPLWRGLPQTPQAAEFAAYASAVQFIGGPTRIYGDCSNVLNQANGGFMKAMAPNRKYSGVVRDTLKYPERLRNVQALCKVKAHVDISKITDETERRHASGNSAADEAAKAARGRHPRPAPAEEKQLEHDIESAIRIIKLAAEAMKKWPQQQRRFRPRGKPKVAAASVSRRGPPHDWQYVEDAWRCSQCAKRVDGAGAKPDPFLSACERQRRRGTQASAVHRGHAMAHAHGAGLPISFCVRCGAWTSRRSYRLAKECVGRPTPSGKQALQRIAAGRHPWLKRGGRAHQRATLDWRTAERPAEDAADLTRGGANGAGTECAGDDAAQRDEGRQTLSHVDPLINSHIMHDAENEFDVFDHGGGLDGPDEPRLSEPALDDGSGAQAAPARVHGGGPEEGGDGGDLQPLSLGSASSGSNVPGPLGAQGRTQFHGDRGCDPPIAKRSKVENRLGEAPDSRREAAAVPREEPPRSLRRLPGDAPSVQAPPLSGSDAKRRRREQHTMQQRLMAAEHEQYVLRRAFEDHAERAAKRRRICDEAATGLTARQRLEALRQRVATKLRHDGEARREDREAKVGVCSPSSTTST